MVSGFAVLAARSLVTLWWERRHLPRLEAEAPLSGRSVQPCAARRGNIHLLLHQGMVGLLC